MKQLLRYFLWSACIAACHYANAQDPHFSQYFSSPLTLNPAATGNFDGSSRLAINYRDQWAGAGNQFSTATLSFDTRVLRNRLKEGDKFGIGVLGLYDRTAGGLLNSSYISVSAAYHKSVDPDGYQFLSLGFQGTMGSKRLDYSKISFDNQFNLDGFDLSIPSGESFKTQSITYFDFNLGAMYNYDDESKHYYIGASYYHIPRPTQSFVGSNSYRLDGRFSVHGGASFDINESDRLFFSGLYMKQGSATDKTLGMSYAYYFPEETGVAVMGGAWYRFNDAIYPYAGVQWNGMQAGISYDINTTSMAAGNAKTKSVEISFIYTFKDNTTLKKLVPWY